MNAHFLHRNGRGCACVRVHMCVYPLALSAKRAWRNEVPAAAGTLSAQVMASKVHPPPKGAGLFGEMADPGTRAGRAPGGRGVSWEKHGDVRKRGSHWPTLEQSEQQDEE